MCVISLHREKTPSLPACQPHMLSLASQMGLHNSSSHPPLLPFLSAAPEPNCPLRKHLFLQVFKSNQFTAWPTVLMQQECRMALLGAKQGAKGRDGQTSAFRTLGSASQEPPSCTNQDHLPYLQLNTTNLASLKNLHNKVHSPVSCTLTPFQGVTGPAKRREM